MSPNATNNPAADKAGGRACFGAGQSPLNIGQLRETARLAQLAYADIDLLATYNVTVAPTAIIPVPRLDLLALVISRPDQIDIVIRGTVDMENWLLNLNVEKKSVGQGVKLHTGFLAGADTLLPLLIAELLPPGQDKAMVLPIRIIGHSLGGALATLVAWFLNREGFNVQDVITFASPRVGNAAWRDCYNAELGDRTLRVVAAGDLVPLIPGILDGYRHVGQEIYLDGKVWLNPSRITELLCDGWRTFWAIDRWDFAFVLKFHSMRNDYLRLLKS